MTGNTDNNRAKPSALFWLVAAAVIAAVVVAAYADGDQKPGFALHSNAVYRLEIGLATLAVLYLIALTLWLAWYGKGFFELPAGIKAPEAEKIEDAARDFSEEKLDLDVVRTELLGSLSDFEDKLDEFGTRLAEIEKRSEKA